MDLVRRRAPSLLAVLFGASGVVHLLSPRTFEPLIPSWLPHPRTVVYTSGMAEIICSGGLLRRTRWARAASVLLLLGIFPGNIQMAVTASRGSPDRGTLRQVLAISRLPLQLPLIWAALQCEEFSTAPRATSEYLGPGGALATVRRSVQFSA
jgi:uncharacterized membrane protein